MKAAVLEETKGEEADVVIVACANPSAQEEAFRIAEGHQGLKVIVNP